MALPLFAMPVVALLTDIRTAIVVPLAPNILMHAVQIVRRRFPLERLKRLSTMLVAGIIGVFLRTYLLVAISVRLVNLILAAIVFIFVGQGLWAKARPSRPAGSPWRRRPSASRRASSTASATP